MTSPDFSEYIDLTINDLQPVDVYTLARDYALVALPEFDPRVGTVEDAMLEAMSYVSGLVNGAVNRLPNGLMEGLLRLMGFFRDEATFASGSVVFTTIDTAGLTIPSGTQVSFSEATDEGIVVHVYETTETVVIAEGESTSDPVQVAAIEAGIKPVISDGASMNILTPIATLFTATFDGSFTQGTESETDEDFFRRASTYLGSLSRTLATASQVTDYLLTTYADAYRVATYDLTKLQQFLITNLAWDGGTSLLNASCVPTTTGGTDYFTTFNYTETGAEEVFVARDNTPFSASASTVAAIRVFDTSKPTAYEGSKSVSGITNRSSAAPYLAYSRTVGSTETSTITYPTYSPKVEFLEQLSYTEPDAQGCVTVFLSSSTGASLSAEDKATIADDIRDRTIAGLTVYIADIVDAPVTVDVQIAVRAGYADLDVRTAVDDYLTNYLSASEYPFTTMIRKNALISQVSQIEGVEYVDGLTLTSSNTVVATVDGNGDVNFNFKGTLPSASVTVTSV